MNATYILTLTCPDRRGIVAAVSQFIADQQGTIKDATQHGDENSEWFFMRVEIGVDNKTTSMADFQTKFEELGTKFQMQWQLQDTAIKKRMIIMVSKSDHCLSDLLHRYRNQDFEFEISCVISNHPDLQDFVEWHQIPYHLINVDGSNDSDAYQQVENLIEQYQADAIVLARYMRILPPKLCKKYFGKIINIHHSFLPSFAGSKPYHQAFTQGVKLIGATCHYVTEKLDAGPIIEQDVIRISHSNNVQDMIRLGRDVEKMVLAKGVRQHLQDRVLIHGNKTVVFD